MIENRVVSYNPSGWSHGCSVTDKRWYVTINLKNTQEVLNFYNFFGFVLSDLKKDETVLCYYHWSNTRISSPIRLTAKDYIFERDNEAQKDRAEKEYLGSFTATINKLREEKTKIYKQYNPSAMYIWLLVCIVTFCMCPVYLIKRKNRSRAIGEIDKKIRKANDDFIKKINLEIAEYEKEHKPIEDANPAKQESIDSKGDYIDELKRLKELLDAEIITKEEFETKKKEILNYKNDTEK